MIEQRSGKLISGGVFTTKTRYVFCFVGVVFLFSRVFVKSCFFNNRFPGARTGQDRTGHNQTGQGRTGQFQTGHNRKSGSWLPGWMPFQSPPRGKRRGRGRSIRIAWIGGASVTPIREWARQAGRDRVSRQGPDLAVARSGHCAGLDNLAQFWGQHKKIDHRY